MPATVFNGLANALPHAFEYADDSARTSDTGFSPSDLHKLALQLDTMQYWILTATTPTWALLNGDASYRHVQVSAATTWTIVHNLGKRPSVTVLDSTGNLCIVKPVYTDLNTVTLTFPVAYSGEAELN